MIKFFRLTLFTGLLCFWFNGTNAQNAFRAIVQSVVNNEPLSGVTVTIKDKPHFSAGIPDGSVRAIIQLPYARLAVFEDPLMDAGRASWYDYKECDCAASPDYPKGTYLVVSRADDPTRAVTVRVNDWGPDRNIFPDRVIDLDKVAFSKIGNPRGGVIDVVVKLLQ